MLLALAARQPGKDAHVALVDRFTETGVMRDLVAGVRESSSGVLVLRGQAGIGKTTLLREMAEQAANGGMRVAWAAGIQVEMEMDFAGLHQLLLPFAEGLPGCLAPSAARSRRCSGWPPVRRQTGSSSAWRR